MTESGKPIEQILNALKERAKELNCLYRVEELLSNGQASLEETMHGVAAAIPPGWQFPHICQVRITYRDHGYESPGFTATSWIQAAHIMVHGEPAGRLEVSYREKMPNADEGPFLREERKLIDTIADRLGHFLMHRDLVDSLRGWEAARREAAGDERGGWRVVVDLLRGTDRGLLARVSRKMINHLCWSGVHAAGRLLERLGGPRGGLDLELLDTGNRPTPSEGPTAALDLSRETFRLASRHLGEKEILNCLQRWIKEDRSSFLVNAVENLDTSLVEITDAIGRYHHIAPEEIEFSQSTEKGLRVSLIRRLFTDQLNFLSVARDYIDIRDFHQLLQRTIFPPRSHGKLGGKSSGLFLAAQIIRKSPEHRTALADIKVPRTWYLTSDGLLNFIYRNNLEEVFNQKYKHIEQVRQEYPFLLRVFKHSHFSPDIVKGLSVALDDLGDRPLIVRSSSLLEDRAGSAFSGKYRSLFLANRGDKPTRLAALLDAITEVYASTFSPDPIQYRAERGLLDFHEEMGILIQEVVGRQVGPYFLPTLAGVAFSRNEFRWSPRIRREDGLVRIVPGLGTRAVDRLSDDYPVLIAPGQPGLRVNVTPEEVARYSPRKLDVINLESGHFETIEVAEFLQRCGGEYPGVAQIVSLFDGDGLRPITGGAFDAMGGDCVVTFEGLITRTPFVAQIRTLLECLESRLGTPVDLEFAVDGVDLYLLQCRPQCHSAESAPTGIPRDLPKERVIFSARRHVSNGHVPDITHLVYVDPQRYAELETLSELNAVGRVVGRLNKLLPKRQFMLMGPGRWGSRGDVKLGVKVTYSDINNAAALIEIARKQGHYVPDLSFGTHFFQDLVESSIRYLPLYPDDPGVEFNERFLTRSENLLAQLLPEHAELGSTVRVIDVAQASDGQVLRLLMNAELDEAVAFLAPPDAERFPTAPPVRPALRPAEEHWRWRLRMAERIAAQLDAPRFGVAGLFLFGSAKNATAGPSSDIDLLVHFQGSPGQRAALEQWMEGWSLCLAETNYLRTGYRTEGLLDLHWVTDADIASKHPFASKIGAMTDAARPLPLGRNTG